MDRRQEITGFGLSALMPKSLMALSRTARSILPSTKSSCSVASVIKRESTSKKSRSAARPSLRPNPSVPSDARFCFENLLRPQHFVENRAAPKQLRAQLRLRVGRGPKAVHAAQNPFLHVARHGRHRVRLVHHRNVIKNILAVLVHPA